MTNLESKTDEGKQRLIDRIQTLASDKSIVSITEPLTIKGRKKKRKKSTKRSESFRMKYGLIRNPDSVEASKILENAIKDPSVKLYVSRSSEVSAQAIEFQASQNQNCNLSELTPVLETMTGGEGEKVIITIFK